MKSGTLKILSGPLFAWICYLALKSGTDDAQIAGMAAVSVWVTIWWLTEAIDLAITSLLPFVLLPLLGILKVNEAANLYMNQVMFLFIGGFFMAFAIEKWGLHQRLAFGILQSIGNSPQRILLGVMLSAFLISNWISNTATVMMLMGAVLSVVSQTDKLYPDVKNKIAAALMIGLAYSATIGGTATIVGTPPNTAFFGFYNSQYPDANFDFFDWLKFGLPVSIGMLLICFLALRFFFLRRAKRIDLHIDFKEDLKRLGKLSYEELMIILVFSATILLWISRSDIPMGSFVFPGWSDLFPEDFRPEDSSVAIVMSLLLFLIPSKKLNGSRLLHWKDVSKLPFDVILLFGCGFALAKGFENSGLSKWLAFQLEFTKDLHPIWIVLFICVLVTVISEFASNIATIQLMLPILFSLQKELGIDPLLLFIPATLSASLGFCMPVATAPNTICFGSGRIKVSELFRMGLIMNVAGILLTILVVMLLT